MQVYSKFRFFLSIFLYLWCLDFEMSGVTTNTRDVGYIPFSREYERCHQTYVLLALREIFQLKLNLISELIISLILYNPLLANLWKFRKSSR